MKAQIKINKNEFLKGKGLRFVNVIILEYHPLVPFTFSFIL